MSRLRPPGFGGPGATLRPPGFGEPGPSVPAPGFGGPGPSLPSPGVGGADAQEPRIRAVVDCGFTERQARFLVLVMRHGGVCIPRQYASFAGIANGGRRCNAFFDRLVRRGYARQIRCLHNRARVFHIHHRPLYVLIGELSSRCRRPVRPRLAVERLMLLDAVLETGDIEWLTTPAEKAAYLARLGADAAVQDSPGPCGEGAVHTRSALASPFPVGVAADGLTLLLYLAVEPATEGFRRFLQNHAALLRSAPRWTVRIVFPRPLDHAYDAYQQVVHEELESPLHPATIGELQDYFDLRRQAARGQPVHSLRQGFLRKGHEVFGAPRFTALYRRWLKHGHGVFEALASPAMAEALNHGRGRVESVVLPHRYRHLAPLVADTPARPELVDTGLRRGPRGGPQRSHTLNPRPQPPAEEPQLSVREQCERDWHRLNEYYKTQQAQGVTP